MGYAAKPKYRSRVVAQRLPMCPLRADDGHSQIGASGAPSPALVVFTQEMLETTKVYSAPAPQQSSFQKAIT
jgi:hypothetical protein